ncbi:MAG: nucleoside deaminase [Verrucomicrobia bacterium]|jgi:tRNA(adenine34) deaminase|nr:nucleoside deaminase [Verrucomicrobiota bacterium]
MVNPMDFHEHYMQMALREAQTAMEDNEVPTGCVIVQHAEGDDSGRGRIIGRAHNQVERLKDPTAHAEMIAITQAASASGDWRLTNTTLYVTKEPCAMCAGAIVLARVPTVVFGVSDPKRGGLSVFNIVQHPDLIHRCEVVAGVLEVESLGMLQAFFRAKREANKTQ